MKYFLKEIKIYASYIKLIYKQIQYKWKKKIFWVQVDGEEIVLELNFWWP